MAGLLWYVAERSHAEQKGEAETGLLKAARFATAIQTEAVATIGQTLLLLADLPLDWAEDENACAVRARQIVDRYASMAGFAVLRASGQVICTQAGPGRGVSLRDRDYVRAAQQQNGLAVGNPVVARVSGQVVVPMALRVGAAPPGTDPPMILAATLDLTNIAHMLARTQNLAGGETAGRVTVFGPDGTRLLTYPDIAHGPVPADHPVNRAVMAAREGVLDMVGHDDTPRLFGFAHASEAGTVYAVSISAASITGPADRRFEFVLGLAALAALGGLGLAFHLARARILTPMALLTEAAARVQAGQPARLPTHAMPHEFDVLRGAMADMLYAMEHRAHSLQLANRDLARLAGRDALTGIANRRAFDTALAEAWAGALERGESVALAIFDVDFFKQYNDRYGHQQGDICLCKVAATLAAMPIREADLAARLGGEEFVLLLPNTETDGAVSVAQRSIEALRDRQMLHEDAPSGVVTASVGVASCRPIPGLDPTALIAAADAALYRAKASGRDRVVTARDVASARIPDQIDDDLPAAA